MHRRVIIAAALLILFIIPFGGIIAQSISYEVQPGDTLYSIARRFNVHHDDIMRANGISDPRNLKVGQELDIPSTSDDASPSYKLEDYRIRVGDTLYSIARRSSMTVNEIQELNNLTAASIIKPGQIIQVRALDGSSSESDNGENSRAESDTPPTPTEGTVMVSTPASGGENQFWPLGGDRYSFNGKFPGMVIKGISGDDILAVSDGRVVYSGPHSTLGKVLFIQNSRGYIYIYGGHRELYVDQGEEVRPGDIIGSLGPVPLLPDIQLYFSVWKDGRYIDPNIAPR